MEVLVLQVIKRLVITKSLAQLKVDNYIYNDTEIQGFYETIGNPDLKMGTCQSI